MGYTFVLIHGSWHSGRAWDNVVERLNSLGHFAYAPTLAGHGPADDKGVTHAQCVDSVIDFVLQQQLEDFVLLGHSFGGTVIQAVAERIPDRIRRLVFHNAFVLRDGESLSDVIPNDAASMFEQLAKPDGGVPLPFPLFRDLFMNDADLETTKAAFATLSDTPRRTQTDKLTLKHFFDLEIPISYLNATDDFAAGHGGWVPGMAERLGFCRIVQMPGSHELMFSNPALLAHKIVEAGRD
ncbi:alpha/beta hydrolase [Sphingobium sp. H39-3-25]|uniref:alpha/beta fold hydrolase n=1 Tax=Sphingobium arseniciresistens TaxID=3030834 RepID=UPI0023B8BEA1|nr:alpha/beta hydrolase [Sphingobium arseniciresistens]